MDVLLVSNLRSYCQNCFCFLISNTNCSVLIYRNMIEFYILTSYPENMLNSGINPSCFCADSIEFPTLLCHFK